MKRVDDQQPATPQDDSREKAKADFLAWFLQNYPPDCILSRPAWHAPKIFRAAEVFLDDHKPRPQFAQSESEAFDERARRLTARRIAEAFVGPCFSESHVEKVLALLPEAPKQERPEFNEFGMAHTPRPE